jgi:hypothetical protein
VTARPPARPRPADYTFDIFISYADEENLKFWVQQYFSPELKSGVSNHLKRPVPRGPRAPSTPAGSARW